MDQTKTLANLNDLARRLRVPACWLRAEADADRIPHLRAGSQRLFNVAAVERVLAERAAQAEQHISPEVQPDGL